MIDRIGSRLPATMQVANATAIAAPRTQDADLKKVAGQLQGVFVQQLFKAMRETVPQGEGFVSGGAGEEIFTSLMDEHLAAETPKHWEGGLGEALYRQLRALAVPSDASASSSHTESSTI